LAVGQRRVHELDGRPAGTGAARRPPGTNDVLNVTPFDDYGAAPFGLVEDIGKPPAGL
jgi:hypothetical protein